MDWYSVGERVSRPGSGPKKSKKGSSLDQRKKPSRRET